MMIVEFCFDILLNSYQSNLQGFGVLSQNQIFFLKNYVVTKP